MRLKSFTAKTLPEAMRLVREQLGPDAVILSTQPSERAGGVRLTAALETGPQDDYDLATVKASDVEPIDLIGQALDYHGVPSALADRLLAAAVALAAADAVTALAGALDAELLFTELPDVHPSRPLMLIGPPGGGKSSTAAKLCGLARLLGHGATFITTDLIKCGALEQAAAYAKALSARVVQMPDPAALDDLLRQCPSDHFVVIDTVGINPFSEDELGHLSAHGKEIRPDKLLVLPGGGDALESAEAAMAFAGAGARLLIASKLDLVRRLGGILAAAHASKLALTAIGISPNIGGGLRPVNPVSLARLLLSGREGAEHRPAMV